MEEEKSMNRKEIRTYARGIVNEYSEEPEGLIKDEDVDEVDFNELINIAQQKVQIDLMLHIPWYFRRSKLISTVADKEEYDIVTDLEINDFLVFENIFHNETGEEPQGLLHAEPDQLTDLGILAGEKGEPRLWIYESGSSIAFKPTPTASESNKYKGYYFYQIPDLNEDTDHDPSAGKYAIPALPKVTHVLVAIDAAKQYHTIDDEEAYDIEKRYDRYLVMAANNLLSIMPSLGMRGRRPLSENIR